MIRVLKNADFSQNNLGRIIVSVVSDPTISVTYSDGATSVSLSCATIGASIHYTTDGSVPSASSDVYSGVITITEAKTIKAIAMKNGMTNSSVVSQSVLVLTTKTLNYSEGSDGVEENVYDYGNSLGEYLIVKTGVSSTETWKRLLINLPDNVKSIKITSDAFTNRYVFTFFELKSGWTFVDKGTGNYKYIEDQYMIGAFKNNNTSLVSDKNLFTKYGDQVSSNTLVLNSLPADMSALIVNCNTAMSIEITYLG